MKRLAWRYGILVVAVATGDFILIRAGAPPWAWIAMSLVAVAAAVASVAFRKREAGFDPDRAMLGGQLGVDWLDDLIQELERQRRPGARFGLTLPSRRATLWVRSSNGAFEVTAYPEPDAGIAAAWIYAVLSRQPGYRRLDDGPGAEVRLDAGPDVVNALLHELIERDGEGVAEPTVRAWWSASLAGALANGRASE